MIDLQALKREADRDDSCACVVTRRWLQQVHVELAEARRVQTTFADMTPALDIPPPARPSR